MQIKPGVTLAGVQWQMFVAAIKVEEVYDHYEVACVITSGCDGKHMPTSLHYTGHALDFRTREFPVEALQEVRARLKAVLGPDYDVVLEKDHFHVEFDPG